MCLFGLSNAGKSTFCNALVGNYNHQNFPIGLNDKKFAFDRWDPYQYTHCIVHEFDFETIDKNTWKTAVEGLPFKINRKHKEGIDGAIQVPMIFVCNSKPKSFEGFENRIEYVEATLDQNEHVVNIHDHLEVDTEFSDHKLSPEIKYHFPIGVFKFPVSEYGKSLEQVTESDKVNDNFKSSIPNGLRRNSKIGVDSAFGSSFDESLDTGLDSESFKALTPSSFASSNIKVIY